MRGHNIVLPKVQADIQIELMTREHSFLCSALHELEEALDKFTQHIAEVPDCLDALHHWEKRAMILERRATILERLEELQEDLGWEVN